MMANHNDVVLRVEFLGGAHGNITHGNILTPFQASLCQLPGLAHVEQRELFSMLEHSFHSPSADFEVHSFDSSV